MGIIKVFGYIGPAERTRGEYGVRVDGGHTRLDDPDGVYVLDPDFGDMFFCPLERAEEAGFVLIGEEHADEDPVRFH